MHIPDLPVRGKVEARVVDLIALRREQKIIKWFDNEANMLIRDRPSGIFGQKVHINDFKEHIRSIGKKLGGRDAKFTELWFKTVAEGALRYWKGDTLSPEEVKKEFRVIARQYAARLPSFENVEEQEFNIIEMRRDSGEEGVVLEPAA
ncbi:MAG: hypothetical protein KGH64_04395 [Candidatus Micrarchaeota archaeon]|nr:hypothetical protein [Candidatus Micrarchaeota archaeon]MDE1834552.1 hypothetical protein [Candidatus Micrarchaeota archaeon]MDE1859780.1 hypothetical protein [Candidatus Micrarchaeota archaeon]